MTAHWGDTVRKQIDAFGPLVLGIDPIPDQTPLILSSLDTVSFLVLYTRTLLDAAQDKIGFVKFQSAYFEAFGSDGIIALAKCIAMARERGFAIILDAKRGDIGTTAAAYARAYLTPKSTNLEVDCLTVNPFLGPDTITPFVDCARSYGKGVLVLIKTSNDGSGWLQDQIIDQKQVSKRIADLVAVWANDTIGSAGIGAIGAVVGATYPSEAAELHKLMPKSVMLSPGLGTQGGNAAAITSLATQTAPVLISASRGIASTTNPYLQIEEYVSLIRERIDRFKLQIVEGQFE